MIENEDFHECFLSFCLSIRFTHFHKSDLHTLQMLLSDLWRYATHKNSSYLIEKALCYCSLEDQNLLIAKLGTPEAGPQGRRAGHPRDSKMTSGRHDLPSKPISSAIH